MPLRGSPRLSGKRGTYRRHPSPDSQGLPRRGIPTLLRTRTRYIPRAVVGRIARGAGKLVGARAYRRAGCRGARGRARMMRVLLIQVRRRIQTAAIEILILVAHRAAAERGQDDTQQGEEEEAFHAEERRPP